jgi:cytochrome c-type biogenesis protein CcmH
MGARLRTVALLSLALALASCGAVERDARAAASRPSSQETTAQGANGASAANGADEERIVEGRLLAPCCYTQTLDVHESPLASELRQEVRKRLAAGESPEAIEDDFVARYGENVRALPKGEDPRRGLLLFSAAVLVASAAGLAALLRRWRRTPKGPAPPLDATAAPAREALDDRIDQDLLALDD